MTGDFEKSFDFSSGIVYFPVRHHSPACSYHLKKLIDGYKPDCVLIEGPSDADHLIEYLADEGTVPPVCIYSSYDDSKGAISEDKDKYRAYYPFLAYSPEYCALKEAVRNGTAVHFIDMPYALQLTMFGADRGERVCSHDETAEYYRLTAEKSGCRSFSEFWERGFEMSLEKNSAEFAKSVYMLGRYMRELSPSDEMNDCRESFMRERIAQFRKEYSRVLVIAGAYHIYGLCNESGKIKMGRYSSSDCGLYLMPYNFAEADSRSGYGAGIPFPAFYSEVWKKLCSENEQPYLKTVEEFIVNTARYARSRQPVSLPDETEALYLAHNLTMLRGKSQPGAFELIDGVRSAFVKGDINSTAAFELDHLYRRMTGLGAGVINISGEGKEKIIPPCVDDFRAFCRKYRINIGTIVRQSTVLDVVKKRNHYEKSCFFYRMAFLGTGFCKRESGPDYVNGTDTSLIREEWSYRYSTAVETKLIDLSVYGGSIEVICRNLLKESYEKLQTAAEAGKFLINLYTLGFSENTDKFTDKLSEIIRGDYDFSSQCLFMSSLNSLINLQKHTLRQADSSVLEMLGLSFETALSRFDDIKNAVGDSCTGICSGIRCMYSISSDYPDICNKASFVEKISSTAENADASPKIYGVCLALRSREGGITDAEYGEAVSVYMLSAEAGDSADFLSGVISAGRDIIFTSSTVLESIDDALKRMDRESFMGLLPKLRGAFTACLPAETARISRSIAELYGTSDDKLSGSMVFTSEEIIAASECDRKAAEIMRKWGMQID